MTDNHHPPGQHHTIGLGLFTLLALVFLLPSVLACKETYTVTEEVLVEDVIEDIGYGAICNITLYQNQSLVKNDLMLRHGLAYSYQFGKLEKGQYISNIQCVLNNSSFLGQCLFEVKGDNMLYVALAMFIMLTFAGFFVIFYFINNLRLELENLSSKPGGQGVGSLKTNMFVKAIFLVIALLLNLTVTGFGYFIANQLDESLANFVFIYFLLCIIGVVALAFMFGYKMYTFPYKIIGDILDKQKRLHRR